MSRIKISICLCVFIQFGVLARPSIHRSSQNRRAAEKRKLNQFNPKALIVLERLIENNLNKLEQILSKTEDKRLKKNLDEIIALQLMAQNSLNFAATVHSSDEEKVLAERVDAFYAALRLTENISVKLKDDNKIFLNRNKLQSFFIILQKLRGFVWNYAGQTFAQNLTCYSKELEQTKLSVFDVKKESLRLVDPNNPKHYINLKDLKGMTHDQVSRLDISDTHEAWYSQQKIKTMNDSWDQLENFKQDKIRDQIKFDHYNMHLARKVVFLDKVKDTATSPKVNGKDFYGVKWKVKWGDESQVEPINNRLYMAAGAKMTDLAYMNDVGFTLILAKDTKKNNESLLDSGCAVKPVTLEAMDICLRKNYKFNISPYILEYAKLNLQVINEISQSMPQSKEMMKKIRVLKKEVNQGKARNYVRFTESMIEYKAYDDATDEGETKITRFGPVALNSHGTNEDRVARSIFLFNAWIHNRDAKDDNSRAYVVQMDDQGRAQYLEGQHDMGAALGAMGTAGDINVLQVEKWFLRRNKLSNSINYPVALLFKPKPWGLGTHADFKWMARNIARITNKQIKDILSYSHWPFFVQNLMTYKMSRRRDRIADLYHVNHLIAKEDYKMKPQAVKFHLSTQQQRWSIFQKLGFISPQGKLTTRLDFRLFNQLIDQALQKNKLSFPYSEYVVQNGKIATCQKSIIIGILEHYKYPSGLSFRTHRFEGIFDEIVDKEYCELGSEKRPFNFIRWISKY